MSGHSKWAQIKRKKGATDVKRGKLFSQLTKAITVAARTAQNLDMAIARAKTANMPADTIDRAMKKGTGELTDGSQIESAVYEAYGPGGAAMLITVLTDNKNRTLAEIKTTLKKAGSVLANSGSVQYLFDRRGVIEVVGTPSRPPDEIELALIEAGAEDIQADADRLTVTVQSSALMATQRAIEAAGYAVLDARFAHVAKHMIPLAQEAQASLLTLMEALDDLDDVESIETNADLSTQCSARKLESRS